jgi:hypothetical protein
MYFDIFIKIVLDLDALHFIQLEPQPLIKAEG